MGGHLSVSHDEATNNSAIQVDFVNHGEASAMGSLIIAIFGDYHTMSKMGWTLAIVNGNLTITAPTWIAGSMAPAITEMIAELTTSDAAATGVVAGAVHKIRSSFSSRKRSRHGGEGDGQPSMGEGEHVSHTMRQKFQQLLARKKAVLDPTYGAIDQNHAQPWAQGYKYAALQQQPFTPGAFPGAESALVPHDPRVAAAAWPNQQGFPSGGGGYASMQHNGYLLQGAESAMVPHDPRNAMMTTWANHPAYHNSVAEHAPLQQNGYLANGGSALVPHGAATAQTAWANQQVYNHQMYHYGGVKPAPVQHNGYLANSESALVLHDPGHASRTEANKQQADYNRDNASLVPYEYPQHGPPAWATQQTHGYPGAFYGC